MKGLLPLFLGILGTFTFSWVGLTMIPNAQIGHLDPQTDEDGNDPYPAPKSGMAERGRKIYVANGCIYCHSQQVRPAYGGSDLERKWGDRRSAPRDYVFESPSLLGKMRMGPDLANLGKRAPSDDANAPAPGSVTSITPGASPAAPAAGASPVAAVTAAPAPAGSPTAVATASPAVAVAATTAEAPVAPATTSINGEPLLYSAAWHHRHLYAPRSVSLDSTMPAFRFLYEKRQISGERAADAVQLAGPLAPPEGWEIVPTYDAKCLVAYLMSLDQSHALKEVKSAAAAAPAAPGKAVK
jgi:cbb3-type cytochrome oxidase cytochrome c subunit